MRDVINEETECFCSAISNVLYYDVSRWEVDKQMSLGGRVNTSPRLQRFAYYMHCRTLCLPIYLSGNRHPWTAGTVRTFSVW
jgi:hypothetical protein